MSMCYQLVQSDPELTNVYSNLIQYCPHLNMAYRERKTHVVFWSMCSVLKHVYRKKAHLKLFIHEWFDRLNMAIKIHYMIISG